MSGEYIDSIDIFGFYLKRVVRRRVVVDILVIIVKFRIVKSLGFFKFFIGRLIFL